MKKNKDSLLKDDNVFFHPNLNKIPIQIENIKAITEAINVKSNGLSK